MYSVLNFPATITYCIACDICALPDNMSMCLLASKQASKQVRSGPGKDGRTCLLTYFKLLFMYLLTYLLNQNGLIAGNTGNDKMRPQGRMWNFLLGCTQDLFFKRGVCLCFFPGVGVRFVRRLGARFSSRRRTNTSFSRQCLFISPHPPVN